MEFLNTQQHNNTHDRDKHTVVLNSLDSADSSASFYDSLGIHHIPQDETIREQDDAAAAA